MNAVIDIGNTRGKLGLFERDSEMEVHLLELHKIPTFLITHKVTNVLVSNVAEWGTLMEKIKTSVNKFTSFTIKVPIPISTIYETPETLGVDRLAACVGARKYAKGNILVIDAGSCITFDFLSKENIHQGGSISPGIAMRLQAMNTFTSNLPLVSFEEAPLEGRSTKTCLQSGAANGTLAEIKGIISEYMKKYLELTVIIGGGDAYFFDKNLKLNTFAVPNLVLEGLHRIFKYNE